MTRPGLVITVDVEEWCQSSWDHSLELTDSSAKQCYRLLDILATAPEARGTFFVLGKFAEKHPGVVSEIVARGHEVACHGYGHVELFNLGPEGFAEDLRRATDSVSEAAGRRPVGFRAPDFSIVAETLWALEILADAGYMYDSSIFPFRRDRYGIEGWPPRPVAVSLASGRIITEVPLATLKLGNRRVPIAGGGYARLLPGRALVAGFRHVASRTGCPAVFYCHPYELDPNEMNELAFPIPRRVRLHQGLGRSRTEAKLRMLLDNFECRTAEETIEKTSSLPVIDWRDYAGEARGSRRPGTFA